MYRIYDGTKLVMESSLWEYVDIILTNPDFSRLQLFNDSDSNDYTLPYRVQVYSDVDDFMWYETEMRFSDITEARKYFPLINGYGGPYEGWRVRYRTSWAELYPA